MSKTVEELLRQGWSASEEKLSASARNKFKTRVRKAIASGDAKTAEHYRALSLGLERRAG